MTTAALASATIACAAPDAPGRVGAGCRAFDLTVFGEDLAGQHTRALLKARELELVRLVLRAGETLPRHAAPGEITLLGLEGRMELVLDEATELIVPGRLLHLEAGQPHGVRALEGGSALLTISLRPR